MDKIRITLKEGNKIFNFVVIRNMKIRDFLEQVTKKDVEYVYFKRDGKKVSVSLTFNEAKIYNNDEIIIEEMYE